MEIKASSITALTEGFLNFLNRWKVGKKEMKLNWNTV